MEISIKKGKKIIRIKNVKKLSSVEKIIGLMFSRRKKSKRLLFKFKKPVAFNFHSLFVFFPFVIIWLDDKNNIVDFKIVKPFQLCISTKKSFCKVLEVPFNQRNSKIIQSIVEDRKV